MNKKIKVAIIVPSLQIGGAEIMVSQLSSNLNFDKFDVHLILLRKENDESLKRLINDKVKVICLNKDYGFNFKSIFDLYKVLNKIHPDVISTHLQSFTYSLLYVYTHKVKILHTIHNDPSMESNKLRKILLKISFKFHKIIPVGISTTISDMIKDYYHISKCETIFNPVDMNKFYPEKQMKKNNKVRFMSAGRLVDVKNHKLLINSFSELCKSSNNVELYIFGDGVLKKELENHIKKLKLENKVFLKGNTTNIRSELVKSDVFVLSSNYEGLPMSILEAMACGLPIISTNVGGIKDIVVDNGILVPANDQKKLTEALILLTIDENKRLKLAENSLKNVKRFSIENVVKDYEELFFKYKR